MKPGRTTSLADPPAADSRRRVPARTRLDFWLDALLLAAYTLAYSLGFTGIATHEWLGIGLGAALLVHLTLHWDWVVRTTRKLLRPSWFWRQVHDTTATLTLILVPVHAALRWRWIAGVARRLAAWRPGRRSR
jgi:hypothetical protein